MLAIADHEEAAASTIGRALAAVPDGLFGWAVAVDDVLAEAQRLGLEVTSIERGGLTARLTGVAQAMAEPWLPFFIQRDPGIADPGATGDAGGIAWLELAADPERLHEWLGGGEDLPLRYAAGEAPVCAPWAWARAPSFGDDRLQRVDDRGRRHEQAGPGARQRVEVAGLEARGGCRASRPRPSPSALRPYS